MRNTGCMSEAQPECSDACRDLVSKVRHLLEKQFPHIHTDLAKDGLGFESKHDKVLTSGILSLSATVTPEPMILLQMEVARTEGGGWIDIGALWNGIASLETHCRLLESMADPKTASSRYFVEIPIQVKKMDYRREVSLQSVFSDVAKFAVALQEQLPKTDPALVDLEKVYGKTEHLSPVFPLAKDRQKVTGGLDAWAGKVLEYCGAGGQVALSSEDSATLGYCIALLATEAQTLSTTLGQLSQSPGGWRGLIELLDNAPGIVVVPASILAVASSRYEVGRDGEVTLRLLRDRGVPVIFAGTKDQLQSVFTAQGIEADPLSPMMKQCPSIEMVDLIHHSFCVEARKAGGISPASEKMLIETISHVLDSHGEHQVRQALSRVCCHSISQYKTGRWDQGNTLTRFTEHILGARETVSGLTIKPRAERPEHVQANLIKLTNPGLSPYLRRSLVGQDNALERLIKHLQKECLTRPAYQPLRWCAQGTPGTGKSFSAHSVAKYLGIPYVNVDAASMADMFTATSQLLGGGRGLVGSDRIGRLEEAAQSPNGALVEISDLDHATPSVRSGLAEIFLQVLETGEAQSGIGKMFSCAKLILSFTMNLPDGKDESVRTSLGFRSELSSEEVEDRVCDEIKQMVSSAFLSRIGEPILFAPLSDDSYSIIVGRTFEQALCSAADRMAYKVGKVELESAVPCHIVKAVRTSAHSFGARILMEKTRQFACQAFLEFHQAIGKKRAFKTLSVALDQEGHIQIKP
jgi:hypothetical protein